MRTYATGPSKITSRLLVGFLAVLVAAGALTACGSGDSSRTLHIWYGTDDPVETVWASQLAALFDKTHKNVQAKIQVYSFDDFNTKMLLALGSGNPPDLAYALPRVCGIPVYVQNRRVVNLTPFAQKYHWAGRLRPGLLQDYNSPFSLYATRKYGVLPKNVPIYAVPDAMAAVGVMYNAAILSRLGLVIPRSLDQLEHDIAVARDAGYTPLGLGNADGWLGDDWYQTLANTQFSYPDLERELRVDPSFTFKRTGFKAMAAVLESWRKDFNPTFAGDDAQDGVVKFFHGRTLFQLISSSEDPQISQLEQTTHMPISVFPFPGATVSSPPVVPQSGYEGWVIPKAGHDENGAVEFINWMLEPSTRTFLLDHGVLPAEPGSPAAAPSSWLRAYLLALQVARPGVFLDAAPMPSLNATMEGNVTFLLHDPPLESPSFLPQALQIVYTSHGKKHGSIPSIDCEF
jgi:raffinose/stachyose/melibiose transport system substrate-binding protein